MVMRNFLNRQPTLILSLLQLLDESHGNDMVAGKKKDKKKYKGTDGGRRGLGRPVDRSGIHLARPTICAGTTLSDPKWAKHLITFLLNFFPHWGGRFESAHGWRSIRFFKATLLIETLQSFVGKFTMRFSHFIHIKVLLSFLRFHTMNKQGRRIIYVSLLQHE